MRIQAAILNGLVLFARPQRPPKLNLENLYVTADERWLVAANGIAIAMGRISDAEGLGGSTLHGLSLTAVARAWQRQSAIISLERDYNRDDRLVAATYEGDGIAVPFVTERPFPDPSALIEAHPMGILLPVRFALHGGTMSTVMKAFRGASNIQLFPSVSHTWLTWTKAGHVPGDFRVLILNDRPASWMEG